MIRKRLTVAVTATALSLAMLGSGATPASAVRGDRDCSDFRTWKQAQRFFKKHGGSKRNDPHRLDADHDGIACEELLKK